MYTKSTHKLNKERTCQHDKVSSLNYLYIVAELFLTGFTGYVLQWLDEANEPCPSYFHLRRV